MKVPVSKGKMKLHLVSPLVEVASMVRGFAGLMLEKRLTINVVDTEQLEALIDMTKADAAEARVELLQGDCG